MASWKAACFSLWYIQTEVFCRTAFTTTNINRLWSSCFTLNGCRPLNWNLYTKTPHSYRRQCIAWVFASFKCRSVCFSVPKHPVIPTRNIHWFNTFCCCQITSTDQAPFFLFLKSNSTVLNKNQERQRTKQCHERDLQVKNQRSSKRENCFVTGKVQHPTSPITAHITAAAFFQQDAYKQTVSRSTPVLLI